MRLDLIEDYASNHGWPAYRLGQIRTAVFRKGVSSWDEVTSLPLDLRKTLERDFRFLSFSPEKILVSRNSKARKALLRLEDNVKIETVLIMPIPGHLSVCVSVQAGCPVKCPFCATGKSGFIRNLDSEEIWDQVLFWNQLIKRESARRQPCISSVVYMGMGEPFLNYGAMAKSIRVLSHSALFGLGQRHISVSTAGHIPGIKRLAADFPQVNLALSLHSANNKLRDRLVPLNRTFPLSRLKTSLEEYIKRTRRKVFIEYALMSGLNDSGNDADELADWIKEIGGGRLLHVNLIRSNPVEDGPGPSSLAKTKAFLNKLKAHKIHVTLRKSLGGDIRGACGQLAGHKTH